MWCLIRFEFVWSIIPETGYGAVTVTPSVNCLHQTGWQRKPARALGFYQTSSESTEAAVCAAFASGSYTQKAIADYFGMHYSTVSKMLGGLGVDSAGLQGCFCNVRVSVVKAALEYE